MSELSFRDYFQAVHEVTPFPWQERLLDQLIEDDTWPSLIDLPTASGKTACIDVALFHLAWRARQGKPWRAARRIVFVVDRRIVVDAAASRAERIRQALETSNAPAVRAVRDALLMLGGSQPFVCRTLRGGMPRERDIGLDPAQPMMIASTVDQIGSRLLFRGYGLNPYSWSLHAGLLGFDTLILLDEAHLSTPFVDTIEAIQREQSRAEVSLAPVQPVRVVPLSATASATAKPFRLDECDLQHPKISERLSASKPAQLIEIAKAADKAKSLLKATLTIYTDLSRICTPAVALIVNRVNLARELFETLRKDGEQAGFDVELMIGRNRPLDRDRVAHRVLERAYAGRVPRPDDRGLVVVATQTIEVGADLDFQGLVTECAAFDALRQRFGRLDRLGTFRQSRAAILGGCDSDDDPIYGIALNSTWRKLVENSEIKDDVRYIDFSVAQIERFIQRVDTSGLNTPRRAAAALTPLHLELLVQTAPRPMYEPDVATLLHGTDSAPADVQVVWRDDLALKASSNNEAILDTSEVQMEVARALLAFNPPASLEAAALPLGAVRSWLKRRSDGSLLGDVEGVVTDDENDREAVELRPVLVNRSGQWEHAFPRDIRPGDTIVVPSEYGGCDEYGFAPRGNTLVPDLSHLARERLQRCAILAITAKSFFKADVPELAGASWRAFTDTAIRGEIDESDLRSLLESFGEHFLSDRPWLRGRIAFEIVEDRNGTPHAVVVSEAIPREGDVSDEDVSSSQTVPVGLADHNRGVGIRARELGAKIGLPQPLCNTVGAAGDCHDLGKADPRFQDLLRAGSDAELPGELLAKGYRNTKRRASTGERHEAFSVALIQRYPQLLGAVEDPELATYLVGSHHGRGRPFMPDRADAGVSFSISIEGRTYTFDGVPALGAVGSGWARTFWKLIKRYGPWGLAYLESVLRLADWLRSAEELRSGGTT